VVWEEKNMVGDIPSAIENFPDDLLEINNLLNELEEAKEKGDMVSTRGILNRLRVLAKNPFSRTLGQKFLDRYPQMRYYLKYYQEKRFMMSSVVLAKDVPGRKGALIVSGVPFVLLDGRKKDARLPYIDMFLLHSIEDRGVFLVSLQSPIECHTAGAQPIMIKGARLITSKADLPENLKGKVDRRNFPIFDHSFHSVRTKQLLKRADLLPLIEKIDKSRHKGSAVFVHCAAGKSRSFAVVTAYLMEKESMSLTDASQLFAEKRPQAKGFENRNPYQKSFLVRYFLELLLENEDYLEKFLSLSQEKLLSNFRICLSVLDFDIPKEYMEVISCSIRQLVGKMDFNRLIVVIRDLNDQERRRLSKVWMQADVNFLCRSKHEEAKQAVLALKTLLPLSVVDQDVDIDMLLQTVKHQKLLKESVEDYLYSRVNGHLVGYTYQISEEYSDNPNSG
jgi:hypothetical protein